MNGRSTATATTASEQAISHGLRTALERVSAGADDENDQHLRGHGLDEPAGMKERLTGMENRQHDVEGEKIEDRTDRADDQHEVADELHIPVPGTAQILFVDLVQRESGFRKRRRGGC